MFVLGIGALAKGEPPVALAYHTKSYKFELVTVA